MMAEWSKAVDLSSTGEIRVSSNLTHVKICYKIGGVYEIAVFASVSFSIAVYLLFTSYF